MPAYISRFNLLKFLFGLSQSDLSKRDERAKMCNILKQFIFPLVLSNIQSASKFYAEHFILHEDDIIILNSFFYSDPNDPIFSKNISEFYQVHSRLLQICVATLTLKDEEVNLEVKIKELVKEPHVEEKNFYSRLGFDGK